jgi:D-alanyl-D-alanine carboxypeptidase
VINRRTALLTPLLFAASPNVALAAGPLQQYLDRLAAAEKFPGAVLLVSDPKGREVALAGLANLKTREPVSAQTRFYVASCGKLATAAVVLQLVEEKKLRLSDSVYPWVKSIPNISKLRNIREVKIEQLLNHRSGLAEYFTDDFEAQAAAQPGKIFSVDESLAFAFGEPAQAHPGQGYSYTNTNYVLLGRLIEEAEQASYAAVLKRRIFDVVGMSNTTVGAQGGPGVARGYGGKGRKRDDVSFLGWNAVTGDGAIVTTALDYEAFLHALFRDSKLLPRAAVARMCRVQQEEPDSGYGLGCSVNPTRWGEAWGHSGVVTGYNAEAWFIPKSGVTVVFLANGDYINDDVDVVKGATRAFLKS